MSQAWHRMVMGSLMTPREHALVEKLGSCMHDFKAIADTGDTRAADLCEVVDKIHQLQHVVLAQAAARAFPARYRKLGSA